MHHILPENYILFQYKSHDFICNSISTEQNTVLVKKFTFIAQNHFFFSLQNLHAPVSSLDNHHVCSGRKWVNTDHMTPTLSLIGGSGGVTTLPMLQPSPVSPTKTRLRLNNKPQF